MDEQAFISRTLNFNKALNDGRLAKGSVDQLQDMQQTAPSHLKWYTNLENGKESIKDFLINLDNTSRVQSDVECIKTIYRGIDVIMESIVNEIAKLRTNFSGRLVKMGSAYNHMKIDKPNEFDFAFEMSIEKILNGKAKMKDFKSDKGRVFIYVDFGEETPDISEFDYCALPKNPQLEMFLSINGSKDAECYKGALRRHGDEYILNTQAIAYDLFNVLDSVVANLELPDNWSHGGYNIPHYSGLRLNIPAYLIQFAYHPSDKQTPLVVSVDFAPVIKLPEFIQFTPMDVVDDYLDIHGYITSTWQRLECGTFKGGYYSFAEEEWLKTYDSNSIPKVVIRVCKALHNMVKLTTPKYLTKFTAEMIAKQRRNKDAKKSRNGTDFMERLSLQLVYNSRVPSQSEFATYADVNENSGGYDYVPSYIFKRIVMALMVLDEQKGREWTEEDVPDLVVSVFMIINDIIMSVNQATPVISSYKVTDDNKTFVLSILPRSEVHKKTKYGNHTSATSLQITNVADQHEQAACSLRPSKATVSRIEELFEISLAHMGGPNSILNKRSEKTLHRYQHELKPYLSLHEAIKQGRCAGLSHLFLRGQFCDREKLIGLDDGIERVFELLKCVSEGAPKALIRIRKSIEVDEDEDDIDIDKMFITRAQLRSLMTDGKV